MKKIKNYRSEIFPSYLGTPRNHSTYFEAYLRCIICKVVAWGGKEARIVDNRTGECLLVL